MRPKFFEASAAIRIITPKNSVLQKRLVRFAYSSACERRPLGSAPLSEDGKTRKPIKALFGMHKNDNNCERQRNRLMGEPFCANCYICHIAKNQEPPKTCKITETCNLLLAFGECSSISLRSSSFVAFVVDTSTLNMKKFDKHFKISYPFIRRCAK